ncbi:MAG: apolipoprotein N-acyltransferase, partial [Spirochaetaceae bacterium]
NKKNRRKRGEQTATGFTPYIKTLLLAIIPLLLAAGAVILIVFSGSPVLFSIALIVALALGGFGPIFVSKNKTMTSGLSRVLDTYLAIVAGFGIVCAASSLFFTSRTLDLKLLCFLPFALLFFTTGTGVILRAKDLGKQQESGVYIQRWFVFISRGIKHAFLLCAGAILYALSFPSFLNEWGLFPLAFFAMVPVLIVINRMKWQFTPLAGFLFAVLSHGIFNYWLAQHHPLALTVALGLRVFWFVLTFPALKFCMMVFPKRGFLLQSVLWVGYEYLSTLGFSGYSYGLIGYSQYLFLPLLQTASLAGVWGVTFMVVFPQAWLAWGLQNGIRDLAGRLKQHRMSAAAYAVLFAALLFFGFVSMGDFSGEKQWRVALVQSNVDPWKGGDPAYESSLKTLIEQSKKAISSSPEDRKPETVIWPETAVVPAIRLHSQMRYDHVRYTRIVQPFLEFMDTQDIPYVTGNGDNEFAGWDANGNVLRKDYNGVLLMKGREVAGVYRKTHLVPYTENFPFENTLPGIYNWLKNSDTHFWEAGGEEDKKRVFEAGGVRFSTPICFEDTFGYLSRNFVLSGCDVLVNVTNDAWAKSMAAQMQHFGISVFRAVENRRSLVRSTSSGMTAAVDPCGRILAMAEPFKANYLNVSVPVVESSTTLYTLWGDWAGIVAAFGSLGLLLVSVLVKLILRLIGKDGKYQKQL